MSVDIDTNMAAIMAANNLAASNAQLQTSITKLSSGSRIVTPADDAGGLAVSMKLSAAADRDSAVQSNIADTNSYLQTQDGAMQVAGQILDRISELKTLYADPTKNSSDLANYDAEFTQLQSELTALGNAQFNGVTLFGSTTLTVQVTQDQASGTSVTVAAANLSSTNGVSALTSSSLTTLGSTSISLSTITTAIQNVAGMRANNGAVQNRLSFASQVLTTTQANLEAANSAIADVDVAQESTQLARYQVLVQAGASMLSQANQSSQIALKLL